MFLFILKRRLSQWSHTSCFHTLKQYCIFHFSIHQSQIISVNLQICFQVKWEVQPHKPRLKRKILLTLLVPVVSLQACSHTFYFSSEIPNTPCVGEKGNIKVIFNIPLIDLYPKFSNSHECQTRQSQAFSEADISTCPPNRVINHAIFMSVKYSAGKWAQSGCQKGSSSEVTTVYVPCNWLVASLGSSPHFTQSQLG